MSKIAVIGTGYVGLVSGAMLSDFGHEVICADTDANKIKLLENGSIPIFEPGLEDVIARNTAAGRLCFTTDSEAAVRECGTVFIAVGTPSARDGSADLTYVLSVAEMIGNSIDGYKVIVDKSTVPIGTARRVGQIIQNALKQRGRVFDFDVVSNPEFLREGSAVYDFSHPDRVVIGADTTRAFERMKDVYRVLYLNETPFIETNPETAEMIKYASNAFLAVKITYINEIANLCEKVGADVQHVAKAMGRDGRISPKFLHAGPGYGGSCFPKDTRALAQTAREYGEHLSLVEATVMANEEQKRRMVEKIRRAIGDLSDKTIAVLGVTFKPGTDDMREAPSLVILPKLAGLGAVLRVFDPQGKKEGAWRFEEIGDSLVWCADEYEAVTGADAVVLLTEWNCLRNLDMEKVRRLAKGRYFFDLRNVYDRVKIEEAGFYYEGVGK